MDFWVFLDRAGKVWSLLAAAGVMAWLFKRLRRADLSVEVAFHHSTVPPDLLASMQELVKASDSVLRRIPVPENQMQLQAWEDFKEAVASDSAKTLRVYRNWHPDIGLLSITLRNKTHSQIKDVRLFLEPKYRTLSTSNVWGVEIGGPFLTAEAIQNFQEGIAVSPNFVLPPLPMIPATSELQLFIRGNVEEGCKVIVDAANLKSRVEHRISVRGTPLIRFAEFVRMPVSS